MPLSFAPLPVPLHLDDTGTVRVSGTRVTLDVLLGYLKHGESPETLAEDFPSVPLADIYLLMAYYLRHQAEVDAYLEKRRQEAAALRQMLEARYDKQAMRERLRARWQAMQASQHVAPDRG